MTAFGAALTAPSLLSEVRPRRTGERLLDEMERRAVHFFYENADPSTGLVRDRARAAGCDTRRIASIASTGFGLSAMCIANQRRYLPRREARQLAVRILEHFALRAQHQRGFYWHFLDMHTGERAWGSEISSIDTAWLLCGVLHARAHFDHPAISGPASEILDRVDWRWMLNGGDLLSHGWAPERGFLPYRWDSYAELLAMYLLALGSSSSAIPASSWNAWRRPVKTYGPFTYISSATPLFTHQYSHAWFDFRRRRDSHADYFQNSQRATLAHKLACMQASPRFPWYAADMWGVTASDSRSGYRDHITPDGTLAPCAAGGSIAFLPMECGAVLENMLARYGSKVWRRYGFIDAFHPKQAWFSPDVIGIDLGIMLLMAENARTGAVWEAVMSTAEAKRGMAAAGFRNNTGEGAAHAFAHPPGTPGL